MSNKYLRAIGYTTSTVALYLGVSLLGWGLRDLVDFFADGPRMGYALVVLGFGLAIGYQAIDTPEGIRGSQGEKGMMVRRQRILVIMFVPLLYATLFFLPFAAQRSIGIMQIAPVWAWIGVELCAAGYALVFLVRICFRKDVQQRWYHSESPPTCHNQYLPLYSPSTLSGCPASIGWTGSRLSILDRHSSDPPCGCAIVHADRG